MKNEFAVPFEDIIERDPSMCLQQINGLQFVNDRLGNHVTTDADRFIKIGYNKKTKSATIQKTDIHFVPDIRSEVILCAHLLSL